MASAIAGLPSTTSTTTASAVGGTQLSSSDFLNLMIQQLEQQDPLNPTDSNQLLSQMSQISTLQSNTQMQSSLSSLTLQQSIGAGGNLIGKTVVGLDGNGNSLNGVVTGITVSNQQVSLELDNGNELPMANVTQIAPTAAATTPAANPQLTSILNALNAIDGTLNAPANGASTPADSTATATGATVTPAVSTSVLPAARAKLASVISALAGVAQ